MCVCVRACVRACMRACVRACVRDLLLTLAFSLVPVGVSETLGKSEETTLFGAFK